MRAKKPKRTKKCPSVVVMLVIVALVAVLGVQIVKVYGQLQAARQTETALDQQLTQQQQENEALRSDLARKNDESFIKALARDLLGLAEEGERIFYDLKYSQKRERQPRGCLSFIFKGGLRRQVKMPRSGALPEVLAPPRGHCPARSALSFFPLCGMLRAQGRMPPCRRKL